VKNIGILGSEARRVVERLISGEKAVRAKSIIESAFIAQIPRLNWEALVIEGLLDPHIFKAIFVVGSTGIGKTTLAKEISQRYSLKLIDSDIAFEKLMQKAGLSLDMRNSSPDYEATKDKIRARAKTIRDTQTNLAKDAYTGLVIDTTGNDAGELLAKKEELESAGYKTFCVFVYVPLDIALERNAKRAASGGRGVKEEILTKNWHNTQNNSAKIMGAFRASSQLWNADAEAGTPEHTQSKEMALKAVDDFMSDIPKRKKASIDQTLKQRAHLKSDGQKYAERTKKHE
jgi:cytidylate kinase